MHRLQERYIQEGLNAVHQTDDADRLASSYVSLFRVLKR
jgi:hypothetical protein